MIIESIYFMLPAYAANACPVVANFFNTLRFLAMPVDFNIKLFNQPLFGHSKTFRGFIVGISAAIFIGLFQYFLFTSGYFQNYVLIDYTLYNALILSFLLGFGALLGDLVKSFIKRRLKISSGRPWPIFDQVDYPIGALLLCSLFYSPSIWHFVIIIIISAMLSIAANIIAYLLKIKKVWW